MFASLASKYLFVRFFLLLSRESQLRGSTIADSRINGGKRERGASSLSTPILEFIRAWRFLLCPVSICGHAAACTVCVRACALWPIYFTRARRSETRPDVVRDRRRGRTIGNVRNQQGQGQPVPYRGFLVPSGFSSRHCPEEHELSRRLSSRAILGARARQGQGEELKTDRQEDEPRGRGGEREKRKRRWSASRFGKQDFPVSRQMEKREKRSWSARGKTRWNAHAARKFSIKLRKMAGG